MPDSVLNALQVLSALILMLQCEVGIIISISEIIKLVHGEIKSLSSVDIAGKRQRSSFNPGLWGPRHGCVRRMQPFLKILQSEFGQDVN